MALENGGTGESFSPNPAQDVVATPPFLPQQNSPLAARMAQEQDNAITTSAGQPADWARGIVGGALKAIGQGTPELMAGFGAAGKVPPGAGALYGVGAAARQMEQHRMAQQAMAMKGQELGLEQQRVKALQEQAGAQKERADTNKLLLPSMQKYYLAQAGKLNSTSTAQQLDAYANLQHMAQTLGVSLTPITQLNGKSIPLFDSLEDAEKYVHQVGAKNLWKSGAIGYWPVAGPNGHMQYELRGMSPGQKVTVTLPGKKPGTTQTETINLGDMTPKDAAQVLADLQRSSLAQEEAQWVGPEAQAKIAAAMEDIKYKGGELNAKRQSNIIAGARAAEGYVSNLNARLVSADGSINQILAHMSNPGLGAVIIGNVTYKSPAELKKALKDQTAIRDQIQKELPNAISQADALGQKSLEVLHVRNPNTTVQTQPQLNPNQVMLPTGHVATFPTPAAAAAFKKLHGLR